MYRLQFNNWDQIQTRKDYKHPWWFAFQNNFPYDHRFYTWSWEQKGCYVYLLCEASRQAKGGTCEINSEVWCKMSNVNEKILAQVIDLLESVQVLYKICTESVHTEQNKTEQNNTLLSDDKVEEADQEEGFTPQDLVDLWNELAHPKLPRVIKLTETRKKAIKKALKDYPEAEFWRDVITTVNGSDFLTGSGPVSGNRSKPWRADLDFVVRKDNPLKIIEGKYQ